MIIFLSILSTIIAISYPMILFVATKMGLMTNAGVLIRGVYTLFWLFPTLKLLSFYVYIEKIKKIRLDWKKNLSIAGWFVFVELLIFIFSLTLARATYGGPLISEIPLELLLLPIIILIFEWMLFFSSVLTKIGMEKNLFNYFKITFLINIAALIAAGIIFFILGTIISGNMSLFTTFE